MKKTLAMVLAAILCFTMLAGCGGGQQSQAPATEPAETEPATEAAPTDEPDEIVEEANPGTGDEEELDITAILPEGKLVVGLDDTFAPMGFRDESSQLVGFDIDLAEAVGEQLGIEIVFQPIAWDAKEMEMESKTIDCVWNGMSRTPERENIWTLSQNYLNNKIVIMTNPGVEITSLDQLAEYNIGTQAKSAALETVQAHEIYDSIADKLNEYPTYDEVILDMQAGRIDVMIVDEVLGQYKNNNLATKLSVASVDFGDDLYCIGFRKDEADLCRAVELAIRDVIDSGKGAEISDKWFGENLLLDIR